MLLLTLSAAAAFVASPHVSLPTSATGAAVRALMPPTASAAVEGLRFLTEEQAREVAAAHGTPIYVYDEATLKRQARAALAFPNAFGLTVRFAMKALPNAAVLQTFDRLGLHIDASSGFEVRRAIAAGVAPERISLSSQETPQDLDELLGFGIKFNACSLQQLRAYGKLRPGSRGEQLGLRFNPGLGSGGTGKTNVGGPSSSFGIWHELMPEVQATLAQYDLQPSRVHTHIGSGSDPAVWQRVSGLSLGLCDQLPSVTVLNLGGGYKVGRMSTEASTDLAVVGMPVKDAFEDFAARTGRKLALEVEPGTFLVANAGSLVSRVQDVVSTGKAGHTFLKLDSGMTEVLRPSLYGAQHPIVHVPCSADEATAESASYILVGHCCESGDLMTPAPDEPEVLLPRALGAHQVAIDDLVVVEGSGAYCSSMSTKNYNSFPEAPEVMLDEKGACHLIRQRQPLPEIWKNEVAYSPS
jgi:diaminopimelate decarboxylase